MYHHHQVMTFAFIYENVQFSSTLNFHLSFCAHIAVSLAIFSTFKHCNIFTHYYSHACFHSVVDHDSDIDQRHFYLFVQILPSLLILFPVISLGFFNQSINNRNKQTILSIILLLGRRQKNVAKAHRRTRIGARNTFASKKSSRK